MAELFDERKGNYLQSNNCSCSWPFQVVFFFMVWSRTQRLGMSRIFQTALSYLFVYLFISKKRMPTQLDKLMCNFWNVVSFWSCFFNFLRNEFQPFPAKKPGLWLVDLLGQPIRVLDFGEKWLEFISQSQIKGDYNFKLIHVIIWALKQILGTYLPHTQGQTLFFLTNF